MQLPKRALFHIYILVLSFLFISCADTRFSQKPDTLRPETIYATDENGFTPYQAYAGEVLSYLMRVVIGLEGAPETKKAWQTRGLDAPLDFNHISDLMYGPVRSRAKILVLDTRMLGLSDILYHYNKQFNLFKEPDTQNSLYPSAELVALRLLMIRKISKKEKINFKEMVRWKAMFLNPDLPVKKYRLVKMGIDMDEFTLLRDVFSSDPMFGRYLDHPFLVNAFLDAGIVKKNRFTLDLARKAGYPELRCEEDQNPGRKKPYTIAILPSMTKMFEPSDPADPDFPLGFKPVSEYEAITGLLRSAIQGQVAALENSRQQPVAEMPPNREKPSGTADVNIHFKNYNKRPLVVFPGNAGQVINGICPDTDMAIIIMGKDVYRSIDPHPEKMILSAIPVFFLDIMDIKYGHVTDEIKTMAQQIRSSQRLH